MAAKGTASKSSTGASMSKYDVEVEGRLQKLEAAVATLQKHSHEAPCDTGVGGDLEAAVRALVKADSLNPTAEELDG
tara:strand:+ start:465 stop:695 length:231 start_codon:yes stop_codon:yes gene_type:complete